MLRSIEGFPHFLFTCMLAWLHGNATLMFSPFPSMSAFLSLLSILAFRRAGSWIRALSGTIDPRPSSLVSTFTRFGRNPSPALQACFGRVCGWLQHGWRWDGWRWEIWRRRRWSENTWNTNIHNSARTEQQESVCTPVQRVSAVIQLPYTCKVIHKHSCSMFTYTEISTHEYAAH